FGREVRGGEVDEHVVGVHQALVAGGRGQAGGRGVADVDAGPGEVGRVAADAQAGGAGGDQAALQLGQQRAAMAALPVRRVDGEQVEVAGGRDVVVGRAQGAVGEADDAAVLISAVLAVLAVLHHDPAAVGGRGPQQVDDRVGVRVVD